MPVVTLKLAGTLIREQKAKIAEQITSHAGTQRRQTAVVFHHRKISVYQGTAEKPIHGFFSDGSQKRGFWLPTFSTAQPSDMGR